MEHVSNAVDVDKCVQYLHPVIFWQYFFLLFSIHSSRYISKIFAQLKIFCFVFMLLFASIFGFKLIWWSEDVLAGSGYIYNFHYCELWPGEPLPTCPSHLVYFILFIYLF